jgi:hypothetical protein
MLWKIVVVNEADENWSRHLGWSILLFIRVDVRRLYRREMKYWPVLFLQAFRQGGVNRDNQGFPSKD